jgi:hypothetical protein
MNARLVPTVLVCCLFPGLTGCAAGILWGCKRPEVTAVSLNPMDCDCHGKHKETGIPFYLPKPLLIVSKNFRNIEDAKTGLTDSAPIPVGFDDQSKYADLNARTNFNGLNGPAAAGLAAVGPSTAATNTGTAAVSGQHIFSPSGAPITPREVPSDGLAPATFFTYQIVFVPDLTQKYGLKIRGGPGEIRAAMNLVNGWQFTGIGPFYMKDSSTAQNILANGISTRLGGQAAADVINAAADLAKAFRGGALQGGAVGAEDGRVRRLSEAYSQLSPTPMPLVNFAEIHVYEPSLTPEGMMEWREIVCLNFNRDYLGLKTASIDLAPRAVPTPPIPLVGPQGGLQGGAVGGLEDPAVTRALVAGVFGVPPDSAALTVAPGGLQGGAVGGVPAGGVNQIQVDCGGADKCGPCKEVNIFRFGGWRKEPAHRAKIQNRALTTSPVVIPDGTPPGGGPEVDTKKPPTAGGGMQGAAVGGAPATTPAIINQPIFNQPAVATPVLPPPPAAPPGKEE